MIRCGIRTFPLLCVASIVASSAVAQCVDYDIVVGGGTAEAEIHWELVDAFGNVVADGDAPEDTGECLDPGCYTMYMYDDGGDGWNGGTFAIYFEGTTTLVAGGTLASGGFGTTTVDLGGGCGGCTDQQIEVTSGSAPGDIWWEIYDQWGMYIIGGGAPENLLTCLPAGCYVMYLYDNSGDGWNGATYTITDVATSTVQTTGTLASGGFASVQVIIGTGCGSCDTYTMTVGAGTAPAEIYWELYDPAFTLIASGGAPSSIGLCLPPECYTLYMYDSFGNGWNGATYSFIDDATSTVVASGTLVTTGFGTALVSIGGGCSSGSCTDHILTVTAGSAPGQVSWNLMNMGINYASGTAPMSMTLCLDTGCYVMQMYDSGANGWNGATWTLTDAFGVVEATGTLASGSSGALPVPLGSGPCAVPTTVSASDCPDAVNVCTDLNFTIDPNGWGAIWEIPALGSTSNPEFYWGDGLMSPWGTDHYGCLMGQEINTTWMIVNISGSGSLEFTLGAGGAQAGFYDWTMFPYTASTCADILANTLSPVRCNWNYASYGGTGLASTIPAGGFPENFEPPLNVLAGQRYIICFSNWSSVTTVVPLLFGGTAVVSCDPLVLPVELLSLQAEPALWSVVLDWATATEEGAAFFNVERSWDLWNWEPIGQLMAAGDSQLEHAYTFSDTDPLEGDNFYRLSVVDVDGTARSSPIVRTEWEAPVLHCWPNPTAGSFLVDLHDHVGSAVLHVIDATGRPVHASITPFDDDERTVHLIDAPPGAYLVKAVDGDWTRSARVILSGD